jgi:predicted dinucleotide-binding enzyme
VVKTLNTVNCALMVDPARIAGSHTLFLSGDDAAAKREVRALVESFGWRDVIDLGDITTARASESYLPLWLSLWKAVGSADFNIQVVR